MANEKFVEGKMSPWIGRETGTVKPELGETVYLVSDGDCGYGGPGDGWKVRYQFVVKGMTKAEVNKAYPLYKSGMCAPTRTFFPLTLVTQ